jgi:hypothetical protein
MVRLMMLARSDPVTKGKRLRDENDRSSNAVWNLVSTGLCFGKILLSCSVGIESGLT